MHAQGVCLLLQYLFPSCSREMPGPGPVERVCIRIRWATDSMGEEDAVEGGEIVMTSGEEEAVPSKPPDNRKLELVQKMLGGCLKHGLAALCKEKPEEPIKWLAHWLLDNNPNQPRVHLPRLRCPALPALPVLPRAARAAPRFPRCPTLLRPARLARQSLCRVLIARCSHPPGIKARASAAREGACNKQAGLAQRVSRGLRAGAGSGGALRERARQVSDARGSWLRAQYC